MRFYALLGEACDTYGECADVGSLRMVRVETDQSIEHVIPQEAFFPPDEGTAHLPDIRFVKAAVYNAGRSDAQKKYATSFLTTIGVRPFDAKVAIELRLAHYRTPPSQVGDGHFRDLKQFISFWKKNPTEAGLFRGHTFLRGVSHDRNLSWHESAQLCLDVPYLKTGLADLATIHGKKTIWAWLPE